jgi:phosphomecalonate degydratase small subunit
MRRSRDIRENRAVMNASAETFQTKACAPGVFEGEAIVSDLPFGFWQGLDPATGLVIDKRHDLCGLSLKSKVFIFPCGRGSTGTPGIFLEAVRNKCAPGAIVNVKSEPMIVMCALLAETFFQTRIPIVDGLGGAPSELFRTGDRVRVDGATGVIQLLRRG